MKRGVTWNLRSGLHIKAHETRILVSESRILHLVVKINWIQHWSLAHYSRVLCRSHRNGLINELDPRQMHWILHRRQRGTHSHARHEMLHSWKQHRGHPTTHPHYLKHLEKIVSGLN
jgi:hypothetical protein